MISSTFNKLCEFCFVLQRKVALSELSDSSIQNESIFSHNESLQTLGSDKSQKKKRTKYVYHVLVQEPPLVKNGREG